MSPISEYYDKNANMTCIELLNLLSFGQFSSLILNKCSKELEHKVSNVIYHPNGKN